MGRIHIKGRILQLIAEKEELWDYEICEAIMKEYNMKGDYWKGVIRVTLIDLYSSGIITSVEEKIDSEGYFGSNKLTFKYRVTDFGKQRMQNTGLLAQKVG